MTRRILHTLFNGEPIHHALTVLLCGVCAIVSAVMLTLWALDGGLHFYHIGAN